MKASEILRKLADVIDGQLGEPNQSQETPASTSGIEGAAQVNTKSMTPPLQQKLDLLKKAAGVDVEGEEECCPQCGCSPCGCEADSSDEDPLSAMKRNAGIPVVVQLASADNDIED
jgi:hypothetical protein